MEAAHYTEASQDKAWVEAMKVKLKALQDNKTWEMVNLPKDKKSI